jgi:hypothetical protein
MDDSIIQEAYTGPDQHKNMYESVILDKNMEGELIKKHDSKLGESYIIVEKGKDLKQLSNKEKRSIDEQDNLRNYEVAKTYANKGTYFYGVIGFATKIAGFFIGLF